MKIKKIIPLLLSITFLLLLSGCSADITQSTNYETHSLKYRVNVTQVDESLIESTLVALQNVIKERLFAFDVANITINQEQEDSKYFLNIDFGTIDDLDEIKPLLENFDSFNLKIQIESPEVNAEEIQNYANEILDLLLSGGDFQIITQNEVIEDGERRVYAVSDWMFRDEIKPIFADKLFELDPGQIYNETIYEKVVNPFSGEQEIYSIIKLFDKREETRTISTPKLVEVSHILIAYQGATRAAEDITRTKEEAEALAQELLDKIQGGEDFAALAQENSDDFSNRDDGGKLVAAAGTGTYVPPFEEAANALENEGDISDSIETEFGFHIIKADGITEAKEETSVEEKVRFGVLFYPVIPNQWQDLNFNNKLIQKVDVMFTKEYDPFLTIHFNEEGKTKYKELIENNMDRIIGVFLGNNLITSFTVKEETNKETITISQPTSTKEADDLKDDILKKPLPAPIIFIEQ